MVGLAECDEEGRVLSANDAFLAMIGYDQADLEAGRIDWRRLTPAEWLPQERVAQAELAATGTCRPFVKEYLRKDGNRVPILIGGAMRPTGGGTAYVIDLSMVRGIEARLAATERELAALIEAEPGAVMTIAADGTFRSLNRAGLAMYEAETLADVLGKRVADHVLPDHRDTFEACHRRVLAGEHATFDLEIVGRHGTRRLVESHSAPLSTVAGVVHLCVVHDVTARRRDHDALRRSQALHDRLLAATNDIAYEWDIRTGVLAWNAQMTHLLGHELEDRSNLFAFWEGAIHPEDREHVLADLQRAIDDPRADMWTGEYRFRRADGSYALIFDRGAFIRDDAGAAVTMIGLMIDITAQRQLQHQLALSERMASLGTLAAGVAHEINNPLAFIQANLDFAIGRLAALDSPSAHVGVEMLRDALDDARYGAERVQHIVRDLKTFSRPDERTGMVAIDQAIESAITIAWNEIKHRARLVRKISPGLFVVGNEAQLAQVFLNLIVNAAQAIPAGAADRNQITVTATAAGADVVVGIHDTGGGIPDAVLARIFEPFYTTKPIGAGTGLGLSICHRIISSLGGRIEIERPAEGGARFVVRLPAAPRESVAAPSPHPVTRVARARVAVIDDEALIGRALSRLLGDEHEVVVFQCAREAIEALERGEACDVILCDLMMPEITGIDLDAWLREHYPALAERTLFMTGGAFTRAASEFVAQHADRCLDKPIDPVVVRKAIQQLLRDRPIGA